MGPTDSDNANETGITNLLAAVVSDYSSRPGLKSWLHSATIYRERAIRKEHHLLMKRPDGLIMDGDALSVPGPTTALRLYSISALIRTLPTQKGRTPILQTYGRRSPTTAKIRTGMGYDMLVAEITEREVLEVPFITVAITVKEPFGTDSFLAIAPSLQERQRLGKHALPVLEPPLFGDESFVDLSKIPSYMPFALHLENEAVFVLNRQRVSFTPDGETWFVIDVSGLSSVEQLQAKLYEDKHDRQSLEFAVLTPLADLAPPSKPPRRSRKARKAPTNPKSQHTTATRWHLRAVKGNVELLDLLRRADSEGTLRLAVMDLPSWEDLQQPQTGELRFNISAETFLARQPKKPERRGLNAYERHREAA